MNISHFLAAVNDNNIQLNPNALGLPSVAADDNVLANAFAATMMVVGAICVLFILIGAARYVISNGNQQDVTQAKNTILYALIGAMISLLAFSIVQFVLGGVSE